MIELNGNYITASDISYVTVGTGGTMDYPYNLTVHLKSGNKVGVNYRDEVSRNRDRAKLVNQIDSELRRDSEQIQYQLNLIRDTARRIDKRQLRIWQQLKALLNLKGEVAPEGNEDMEEES